MNMNNPEIKDGDLFCYATIYVGTHGFMIRPNETFHREVELSEMFGVELKNTHSSKSPNVSCDVDKVEKMIRDDRSKDASSFIMVYRAGKTAEEVVAMIQPQLKEHMLRLKKVYEALVKNTAEMIQVLEGEPVAEHVCPPMKAV